MRTYQHGPYYKYADGDLTVRKILGIIEKMNTAMPQYTFELEPISQGGIRVKYPDPSAAFKSFRFSFRNWPYINPDGTVKSEKLDEPLVSNSDGELTTFMKAFRNASSWTVDEILCVDDILREEGLVRTRWIEITELFSTPT